MCLSTFHKDKSPNPYGWTVEFYLGFVEVLGDNLLQVVEEMRSFSKAPWLLHLDLYCTHSKGGST